MAPVANEELILITGTHYATRHLSTGGKTIIIVRVEMLLWLRNINISTIVDLICDNL